MPNLQNLNEDKLFTAWKRAEFFKLEKSQSLESWNVAELFQECNKAEFPKVE